MAGLLTPAKPARREREKRGFTMKPRPEGGEEFLVQLSKPEWVAIADGEGVMTIIDDD